MKPLRSVTACVTSRVSVLAGAAVAAMLFASIAGASVLGQSGSAADGDPGLADLHMEGSVDQATAAVGDSITWHLTVDDYNTYPATNVWIDVTLPANVSLVSSYADRGSGCVTDAPNHLHCSLDWLSKDVQFGHVILVTKVTGTGDHVLTAIAGYNAADPVPANNTLTLTSTTPEPPAPPAPPSTIVLPVIGTPAIVPGPLAGKRVTVRFQVTSGDTGAPVTVGTTRWQVLLFGNTAWYRGQVANGVAQLSLMLPKTAKGKQLKVGVTVVTPDGGSASRMATFRVR
jgi:uncharacterized repeat protein (TIGR01451 family)